MLKPLLISADRRHRLIQGDNFGPVLDQHLVPGVHHGRLVKENLLHVLQLEAPLVYVFLQLPECHNQYRSTHSSGHCSKGRKIANEKRRFYRKVIVEAAGAAAVVVVLLVRLACTRDFMMRSINHDQCRADAYPCPRRCC